MELTQEHFDQALKGLATKKDLAATEAPMATKEDLTDGLAATEARIIKRIDKAQEELARMVSSGFEDIQERLDVTERLDHLENWARQTSHKVGIDFNS